MAWLDRFLFWNHKRPEQLRPFQKSIGDAVAGGGAYSNVSNSDSSSIVTAVSHAKTMAADITDKAKSEAHEIVAAAEKTAAEIELEAKKRAFQFLVQETQAVEKEVAREYKLVLSRLSESLQKLSSESLEIDNELKRKMAMLAANRSWLLEEAKTTLLGTNETGKPEKGKLKAKTGIAQTAVNKVKKRSRNNQPKVLENVEIVAPEPLPETVISLESKPDDIVLSPGKQQKDGRKFFSFSIRLPWKSDKKTHLAGNREEGNAEILPTPPFDSAPLDGARGKRGRPSDLPAGPENIPPVDTPEESRIEPESRAEERFEKVLPDPPETPPTLLEIDKQSQYSGEVELMIAPPVDLKLVALLYNYLQTIPELKVLYTRGSWNQGTTLVVVLEKPFALIKTITAIPGVTVTVGLLAKDAATGGKTISLLRRKSQTANRLGLILKEVIGAPKT